MKIILRKMRFVFTFPHVHLFAGLQQKRSPATQIEMLGPRLITPAFVERDWNQS
jgi:hypothetical protein